MPKNLILNMTSVDPAKVPPGMGGTIDGLMGATNNPPKIVSHANGGLEQSYLERIESIANAARNVCRVLKPANNSNKQLQENLDIFLAYIDQLENEYKEAQKDKSLSLKTRQAKYLEFLRTLYVVLSEKIIPYTDNFPVKDPEKLAREMLAKAEEYQVLTTERPILTSVTPTGDNFIVQIEVPQVTLSKLTAKQFLDTQLADSNSHPTWYQVMSDAERVFFDDMMKGLRTESDVIEKVKSVSSMTRTIPATANYSRHIVALIDKDGNLISKQERYRSSLVASRDILHLKFDKPKKDKLRVEFAKQNIEKIIETFVSDKFKNKTQLSQNDLQEIAKTPFLIQTLLSPVVLRDDFYLFKDKIKAIDELKKNGARIVFNGETYYLRMENLLATNHPINLGRHFVGTKTLGDVRSDINKASIGKIIELARASGNAELLQLADSLEEHDNVGLKGLDANRYELHAAALEEFALTRLQGVSYGSCLSGKDRKGIEVMYADAVEIYFLKYKKLPKYKETNPEDRNNFVNIMADLYISRHQHLNAGQNSPGSNGIKTPGDYLPDDVRKAIVIKARNENIFKESERVAGNNLIVKQLKKSHEDKAVFTPEFVNKALSPFPETTATKRRRVEKMEEVAEPAIPATKTIKRNIKLQDVGHHSSHPTNQMFAAAPVAELVTGGSANVTIAKLKEDEANVCDIYASGHIRYIETQHGGLAKSQVDRLPNECYPVKVWANLHAGFLKKFGIDSTDFSLNAFNRLYVESIKGGDGKLEKNLEARLPEIEEISKREVARYLSDAYHRVLYGNMANKIKLPSDNVLILAISQIEGLRALSPGQTILLKSPISEAYAKAALLYAASQGGAEKGYPVKLGARYQYLEPLDGAEVNAFKKLLVEKQQLVSLAKSVEAEPTLAPHPGPLQL